MERYSDDENGNTPDVVIVLGMHRSGTSAIAGALTMLGGGRPKHLMPPNGSNPRGFFESLTLVQFNDELLASGGSGWSDWRAFNPGWGQSPVAADFRERAKSLFAREFEGEALPILKDPRICRIAPFWFDVLREMHATPRVVMPIRSPLDVAQSLRAVHSLSLTHGLLLWLRHVLDAEWHSRTTRRSIFTWGEFRADWRRIVTKIAAETHLAWPRLSDRAAREIDHFLSGELVHHDTDIVTLATHGDVNEWTLRAYEALLELAHNPHSNSAFSILDEVRQLLNQSERIFGRLLIDSEIDLEEAREREAKSVRESAASTAELAARVDAVVCERDDALKEVDSISETLAKTVAERDSLRLAFDAQEFTLRLQEQEVAKSIAAEKEHVKAAEELAKALSILQQNLDHAVSARIAAETALQSREAKVIESASHIERLLVQVESLNRALENSARRSEALESELTHLKSQAIQIESSLAEMKRHANQSALIRWSLLREQKRLAAEIRASGLFDTKYYCEQFSDIWKSSSDLRNNEMPALIHYVQQGAFIGGKPNAVFDSHWYLENYRDVRKGGLNPLWHYHKYGWREGRDPGPSFSTQYYLDSNVDVRTAGTNPLAHYLACGRNEGRRPIPPL